MSLNAIHKRGGRRWAYKRTRNGADYVADAVRTLTIGTAGTGYSVGATLTGTGGSGTGFAGIVSKVGTNGAITEVRILKGGSGYTSAPTIVIGGAGSNGAITCSLTDTWHDGVHRKMSDINFKQPLETDELEDGSETPADYSKFEGTFDIQSAQDDASLIKFLKDDVIDQEFSIFIERGKGDMNKVIEFFFPIVQIGREYDSKSGDRKPTIKMKFFKNDGAIVPSNVPSWAKGVAVDYSVADGEIFQVKET